MINLNKVTTDKIPFDTYRWIAYSVFVPTTSDVPVVGGTYFLIGQIHGGYSPGTYCSTLDNPYLTYEYKKASAGATPGPRMFLRGSATCDSTYDRNSTFDYPTEFTTALTKGVWQDVVIQLKYSNTDGYTRVYVDGVLEFTDTGLNAVPNTANTTTNRGYWTMGVYAGLVNTGENYTVYIDEFRLGDENATYSQVCPPIPPLAPTVSAPVDEAVDQLLNPALTASAYQEGYADAARSSITDVQGVFRHYATQFQVDVGASPTWATPIYDRIVCDSTITRPSWCTEQDSEVNAGGTVSTGTWAINLANNTLYSARVRHANIAYSGGGVDRDGDGTAPPTDQDDVYWGPWSAVTTFTTIAAGGGGGGPGAGTPTWSGSITGSF